MAINESIFKAYDIRGIYPTELNEDLASKIAQAYVVFVRPIRVVLSRDVRPSSAALFETVKTAFVEAGVDVLDIGVISTDMLYFAVAHYGYDGGITISASHNPKEYTGMKMVREKAIPISGDTGIVEIKKLVLERAAAKSDKPGTVTTQDITEDYIQKCLSSLDVPKVPVEGSFTPKTLKVVANAMFGLAVQVVSKMKLPIELIPLNEVPDGTFPKGQPDPMLEQNRVETSERVVAEKADMGVAWDADADRCFIYDENGRPIPPYYLTAFLGEYFAKQVPGAKVIHDTRLIVAIEDKVTAAGGHALANKAGHSFFKERMRSEDAVFAGESSGHFYFRDFYYSDNGLIPFLIMLEIASRSEKKVSELFDEYFDVYQISGEINTTLASQDQVQPILVKMEEHFGADPKIKFDKTDGLSIETEHWRANVRGSNTEPLIRVNVEAGDKKILKQAIQEVLTLIG